MSEDWMRGYLAGVAWAVDELRYERALQHAHGPEERRWTLEELDYCIRLFTCKCRMNALSDTPALPE